MSIDDWQTWALVLLAIVTAFLALSLGTVVFRLHKRVDEKGNEAMSEALHLVISSSGRVTPFEEPEEADALARQLNAVVVTLPVSADYRVGLALAQVS